MKKRILAILLLLSVLFSSSGLNMIQSSAGNKLDNLQSEKKDKQSELDQLKKDKEIIRKSLEDAKNKVDEQARVVELMYEEIDICQKEIDTLSALIDEYFALIKEKEDQIVEINARMDRNFELFKKRLVFAQENGDLSLIEFVLDADNIADLLSRSEQVKDMLENDRKIIEDLARDKEEIEAAKKEIEDLENKCEERKAELEESQNELNEKVAEASAKLEELKADQAKQQEYMDAKKKEEDAIEKVLDDLGAQIKAEQDRIKKEEEEKQKQNQKVPTGWIWPVDDNYSNHISQKFKGSEHSGLDISTEGKNGVVSALAVDAGTVVRTGVVSTFGNLVIVRHDNGYYTYYAHLARIIVSVGQRVSQGQQVGLVGSTGRSTGPHLHICVVLPDAVTRVDPQLYLPSHR